MYSVLAYLEFGPVLLAVDSACLPSSQFGQCQPSYYRVVGAHSQVLYRQSPN